MGAQQIVVIEDDAAIREGVSAALRSAGYEPVGAADGEEGLVAARRPGVALVLLDLMLPKRDGLSVLRELRATRSTLPIIILTAMGSEHERVAGLEAGADDYMVKPFSVLELRARVEAVLRRSPERPAALERFRLGEIEVDLNRREARGAASTQALSETECQILGHLAGNFSRAISREELLSRLWGLRGGVETRTVDMHVARLRAKLGAAGGDEGVEHIATVRGKGYMLAHRPETD